MDTAVDRSVVIDTPEGKREFDIASDAYEAGKRDDGHPFIAENYYVTMTNERGERWAHKLRWVGCEVDQDEEGYNCFTDVRAHALEQAAKLLGAIVEAGGAVNLEHWDQARPVYGSDAYVEYGQYDDWVLERKEAGVAL